MQLIALVTLLPVGALFIGLMGRPQPALVPVRIDRRRR